MHNSAGGGNAWMKLIGVREPGSGAKKTGSKAQAPNAGDLGPCANGINLPPG